MNPKYNVKKPPSSNSTDPQKKNREKSRIAMSPPEEKRVKTRTEKGKTKSISLKSSPTGGNRSTPPSIPSNEHRAAEPVADAHQQTNEVKRQQEVNSGREGRTRGRSCGKEDREGKERATEPRRPSEAIGLRLGAALCD